MKTIRDPYALLIDPRDDTMRYVECAIDIDERLSRHLHSTSTCLWLAELKKRHMEKEERAITACSSHEE